MNMEIKTNYWIEFNGEVVLSRWRVRLLKEVADTGSISGAAKRMHIPYHRAWDKIHECESRLGVKLLETQTGGGGGGGAQLTPKGIEFINRFDDFLRGLDRLVQERFDEAFAGLEFDASGEEREEDSV